MTIFKLGGMAKKKGFAGPTIGVKVADQNQRQFSEDQLKEGQSIIGLQVRRFLSILSRCARRIFNNARIGARVTLLQGLRGTARDNVGRVNTD